MKHWLITAALVATCFAFVAPAAFAEDWSQEVLDERDPDRKEQLTCVNAMRKSMDPQVLATLLQRERHGPAVVQAFGWYFEKKADDPATPALLTFAANRPDIGAQAVAYASLSPVGPQIIRAFSEQDDDAAQQVAARMAAAYALMRDDADRARLCGEEPNANNRARGPITLTEDFTESIQTLVQSDDELTQEYALLAAGWDGVALDPAVLADLRDSREPGVAMAAQLYLSMIAPAEVDREAVLRLIERGTRRRARGGGVPPLGYEVRATPQHYAVMAAGHAGLTDAIDPLLGLLTDDDVPMSVEAAGALGRIQEPSVPGKLVSAFDQDLTWPVRVRVYEALGLQPDKASVAVLRERYDTERGRLRQDALYALLTIIAGQCETPDILAFDRWWETNGEGFVVDPGASAKWRSEHAIQVAEVPALAGFYDAKVISDRPVFAVDASLSMRGEQIESLKIVMQETVNELPEFVKFNIVDFGGHVRVLAPGGLIPARNSRVAMERFLYDMELTYGTRSYEAIERAAYIPDMDSVHFLSDGDPAGSALNEWDRMRYAKRLLFRYVPVAVNIVYFPKGKANKRGPGVLQMQRLVDDHAGTFVISGI